MRPLPLISAKGSPERCRSGTLARSRWKLEGADKLRKSADGCAGLVSLSFMYALTSSGDLQTGAPAAFRIRASSGREPCAAHTIEHEKAPILLEFMLEVTFCYIGNA